jgi:hypothetical protein
LPADVGRSNCPTKTTHPFDELLPVFINDAFREPNLPKTYVLVHLLRILGVEGAPATAHLEEKYA